MSWAIVAEQVATEVERLWPHQTVEQRGLALGEEAGEVQRAILKRDHARQRGEAFKGKTADEWTENLRLELGQLVGVALDIAHREGFDLWDEVAEVVYALRMKPSPAASDHQVPDADGEFGWLPEHPRPAARGEGSDRG